MRAASLARHKHPNSYARLQPALGALSSPAGATLFSDRMQESLAVSLISPARLRTALAKRGITV